ncbi:Hypothetical protein POVR1_LOCUS230 [uncultured virus]|nr:Hypothetical protein POVR1_LOCUS230 [uncultured virus]
MDLPLDYEITRIGQHTAVITSDPALQKDLLGYYGARHIPSPFDLYLIANTPPEQFEEIKDRLREVLDMKSKTTIRPRQRAKIPVTPKMESRRRVVQPSSPRTKLLGPQDLSSIDLPPFFTGVDEIDSNILLQMDSLDELVRLSHEYPRIIKFLNNPELFEKLRDRHDLFYIRTVNELFKFATDLKTLQSRTKTHYGHTVNDYRVGDRVIFGRRNYKVIAAKPKEIQLKEVNYLGNHLSDAILIGVLTHNEGLNRYRRWYWTSQDVAGKKLNVESSYDLQILRGIVIMVNSRMGIKLISFA